MKGSNEMKNKIEINNCYFHGLAGDIPFWDEDRVTAVGIQQLRKIVETKGIYSRRILRERYGINNNEKEPKYNGDKYISLCIRHPDDSEFRGEFSGIDPAFFRYVRYKIGIALDSDIINKCNFRQGDYKRLPGERQVLDNIDISNFTAVVIGVSNKTKVIEKVEDILKEIDIPITDLNGNILTSKKDKENWDIEK